MYCRPKNGLNSVPHYNNNRYISQYGSKGATIEDDYATRLAMIGGKESYYFLNDPRWTEPGYGNLKLIDWQDEFFRLAPIQNYQLSLSSGRGNTKYLYQWDTQIRRVSLSKVIISA